MATVAAACSRPGLHNVETVKVVVRVRPPSEREIAAKSAVVVSVDPRRSSVTIVDPPAAAAASLVSPKSASGQRPRTGGERYGHGQASPPKEFTFDQVFGCESAQEDVYNRTARGIVESVLSGYNGTIFAYGQTGTGKTHTMEGSPDAPGIILRAFAHIFTHIRCASEHARFLVRGSYLEIYNEDIRDLLLDPHSPASQGAAKLELKEDLDSGVYVKNLTWFVVNSETELENLMKKGNELRSVGATLMNARSSRSHSIFTVTIECASKTTEQNEPTLAAAAAATAKKTEDENKGVTVGKLYLVDLAGSERQSKTGASGDRLREASMINLSLSSLGNVIKALVDAAAAKQKGLQTNLHIPYRDSRLTRLLQDSLGGTAKTVMIATLSPAAYNYDESISTLRFASRAKKISNKPRINEDPKNAMLRQYQEEIIRLRHQLEAAELTLQQSSETTTTDDKAKPQEDQDKNADDDENDNTDEEEEEEEEEESKEEDEEERQKKEKEKKEREEKRMVQKAENAVERELRLKRLNELREQAERERMAIKESRSAMESEKLKLLNELKARDAETEAERTQRAEIVAKIEDLESKILVGGENLLEIEERQRRELAMEVEAAERHRREQQELQESITREEEARLRMEDEYVSLQEEASAKSAKIKKLWAILQTHRAEVRDLADEVQREREELLDTVRGLTREARRRALLVDLLIPRQMISQIERACVYDEVTGVWTLKHAQFTLNGASSRNPPGVPLRPAAHRQRSASAVAESQRPMITFVRRLAPALPTAASSARAASLSANLQRNMITRYPNPAIYYSLEDQRNTDLPRSAGDVRSERKRSRTAKRSATSSKTRKGSALDSATARSGTPSSLPSRKYSALRNILPEEDFLSKSNTSLSSLFGPPDSYTPSDARKVLRGSTRSQRGSAK